MKMEGNGISQFTYKFSLSLYRTSLSSVFSLILDSWRVTLSNSVNQKGPLQLVSKTMAKRT